MSALYDEGYIKYQQHWQHAEALSEEETAALRHWRRIIYDLGWIGHYPELGVGYGNISMRCAPEKGRFIISATQTGHLSDLEPAHITTVQNYDIPANQLWCRGPLQASSESLTHAAVYELDKKWQAVIHIHEAEAWKALMHQLPTSDSSVPYGTPEMALEVKRLYEQSDLSEQKILVMGGHEEGIISFGESLEEATQVLLEWLNP
ncbi:MAG: class II aldolase/adducin family protein [Bacteroidota bacterium]